MRQNLKSISSRLLVSVVGIPLVLLCFVKAPPVGFFLFVLVFTILIAFELMNFVKLYSLLDKVFVGLCATILVGSKYILYRQPNLLANARFILSASEVAVLVVILLVVYQGFWGIFGRKPNSKNIGQLAFIFIYSCVLGSFAIEVRSFHLVFPELISIDPDSEGARAIGTTYLAYGVLLCFTYDTVAYYVGRPFGKHKLGLTISPNKSWEGSLAGLFVCLLVHFVFSSYVNAKHPGWAEHTFFNSYWRGLLTTLFITCSCQFGDLLASVLKRRSGIKDSGKLFFSHGGVVDRTDSILFAILATYFLMRFSISL